MKRRSTHKELAALWNQLNAQQTRFKDNSNCRVFVLKKWRKNFERMLIDAGFKDDKIEIVKRYYVENMRGRVLALEYGYSWSYIRNIMWIARRILKAYVKKVR